MQHLNTEYILRFPAAFMPGRDYPAFDRINSYVVLWVHNQKQ